ncbi:MAG: TolC family protein [Bacteroidales bacterium]|nr:TolC family protein [Bacteroidales bacterium]
MLCCALFGTATAQNTAVPKYEFTLEDVVQLAKEQSNAAIAARHLLRSSYYSYMAYKANYLPKIILTTRPTTYEHSISTVNSSVGGVFQSQEVKRNTFTSSAGLDLSQNVALTGGSVSLVSDFRRVQNLSNSSTDYTTSPLRLLFNQPLNGYNELKWERKVEPLRYAEAKQSYIAQLEAVSYNATMRFFNLASAQIALTMAKVNLSNNKELYEISKGRYMIGTIAEDALLQMELRYMQAESALSTAQINIEFAKMSLRSYLGFRDNVEIELNINPGVPSLKVPADKALTYAMSNSAEVISYNRQVLEAEQAAARAKSQKGVTVNLSASYGLNKTGTEFSQAYSPRFDDTQGVSVGISIPILDWNESRNRYREAKSRQEMVQTQMQQSSTDFQQQVFLQVMQFNMQENQVYINAKADTVAQKGYEVARQRYFTGKVTVTDLNIADDAKNAAKQKYIQELGTYWQYYYRVRQYTLFDFLNNKPLDVNFDDIIGK